MKRRKWAIALIILAAIALVAHYLYLTHLPDVVRYLCALVRTVSYSLLFVCSFALCTQKRAKYAYYGLLFYQALVLAISIISLCWVQQSIKDPTLNENIPKWFLTMAEPWYAYTQLGLTAVLTSTVFILELPKVNWMLGLIAIGNLTSLLGTGIYKLILLLVRFPNLSHKNTFSIKWIPLWIIGAIIMGIQELKGKEMQTTKEIMK